MEKLFAVIENNLVVNIIVGVEDEVVAAYPNKYVEYTDKNPAAIGWSYDGTNFIAPVVEEPTE
jgi:hypothetical protein